MVWTVSSDTESHFRPVVFRSLQEGISLYLVEQRGLNSKYFSLKEMKTHIIASLHFLR